MINFCHSILGQKPIFFYRAVGALEQKPTAKNKIVGFSPISKQTPFLNRKLLRNAWREKDYRALTPLFTSNINPYGVFTVDFDKPSFLMAA